MDCIINNESFRLGKKA